MAASNVYWNTRTAWGEESTFGTEASTIDAPLGKDRVITTRASNELIEIRDLGDRDIQELKEGPFRGTWTAEFTAGSFYWLKLVLGTRATAGGGPYTHTFTRANNPPSATLIVAHDLDTDSNRKLLGCKVNTMTMRAETGQPIKVTLDGIYRDEDKTTTAISDVTESEDSFMFWNASFAYGGTSVSKIQSIEWVSENGFIMVDDIGTRLSADYRGGPAKDSIRIVCNYEVAATFLEGLYGASGGLVDGASSTASTAVLTITNSDTSPATDERKLVLTLANLKINSHEVTSTPGEAVNQDVEIIATTLTSAVYTNNTAGGSVPGGI